MSWSQASDEWYELSQSLSGETGSTGHTLAGDVRENYALADLAAPDAADCADEQRSLAA
jgi:hypothetical protein